MGPLDIHIYQKCRWRSSILPRQVAQTRSRSCSPRKEEPLQWKPFWMESSPLGIIEEPTFGTKGSQLEGGREWDPSPSLNCLNKKAWSCSTCFVMVDMPLDLLYTMRPLGHLVRKAKFRSRLSFYGKQCITSLGFALNQPIDYCLPWRMLKWLRSFGEASTKQVVSLFPATFPDQEGHHHYEARVPSHWRHCCCYHNL